MPPTKIIRIARHILLDCQVRILTLYQCEHLTGTNSIKLRNLTRLCAAAYQNSCQTQRIIQFVIGGSLNPEVLWLLLIHHMLYIINVLINASG